MTTKYADRAFVAVNGTELAELESASMKQNFNAREVGTMTRKKFNKGFVQGNTTIDISSVIAIRNKAATPKLEAIDYESNDVSLSFEIGLDLYTVKGLFPKDVEDNAGGIGDEGKRTFNWGALEAIDNVGNPIDFDIAL